MRETTNRFVSKHLATVLQRNFLNLKNDSKKLFILPLFIFMMLFAQQGFAQVSVTATAGTLGPTAYTTVNGAFAAINTGTHQGAITINIVSNTTETAACVLNSSGAGSANYTSVLLRPVNDGVTIAGPTVTGRGLIELNGADNVTIDGDNPNTSGINKNLTITNTAATTVTFTSVIRIATSTLITTANNVTIKNCNLNGSGNSFNVSGNTSFTATQAGTNVIFAGAGASTAAVTTAPSALSSNVQNSASGQTWTNLTIDNNSINSAGKGICLGGTTDDVCPTLTITNNIIGNPTAGATNQIYWRGISINGGFGSATGTIISGNTIYVESFCGSTSAPYGLAAIDIGRINGTAAVAARRGTISNNKILRVKQNNTGGLPAFGIILQGGNNITISNNFIQNVLNTGNLSFSTTYGAQGIFVSTGNNHNIYHNTVSLTGTDAGSGNIIACLSFAGVATTGCDVRNNIFSNTCTSSSTTSSFVGVYFTTAPTAGMALIMNNNAYYTGSTSGLHGIGQVSTTKSAANLYIVANFNPALTTPATNWRAITSVSTAANDNASVGSTSAAPFVSSSDIHLNNSASNISDVEQKGSTTTGVTTDIDGDVRPNSGTTIPDIGADEVAVITPPVISFTSISPNTNQCSATARLVTVSVTTPVGTVSGATLNYNNGASGSVAMTNTTGTTWTGTIPAASPTNTIVTWSVTATNSLGGTATYTGTSYQDNPNFGITATATATPSTICSGSATSLNLIFGSTTPPTYTAPPAVTNPTTDEDFGNITITQGATTILNNTSGANTLVGTIGTASGTAGSYSNFTAFGPYALRAGLSYNFSASTINTTFGNAIGIYIDYNRDGDFIDAGEAVYVSASTTTGSHTETGSFSVPASVSFGYTRMRIVVNEGAVTGPTMSVTWGEYEEYLINLQPDVTAYSWSDGSSSVGATNPLSQSPTTNTSYTCTATVNGCPVVSNTVAVVVTNVTTPTANVDTSTQCGSGTPTVSVSGTGTFKWYTQAIGGTEIAGQSGNSLSSYPIISNTRFYVSQVSGSCESGRVLLKAGVISPDALTAASTTTAICYGSGSYDLSVTQTGSTNSYTLTWTASPVSGSGIGVGGVAGSFSTPTTITPTAPGTYIYTITGVDGSCTATNTVSVTVSSPPAITTNPTSPSVAGCLTINASLTAAASNATSYQWQSSSTLGGTYTNVVNGTPTGATYTGATLTTLNISTLNTTYFYRMVASSAGCTDAVSTAATVTVNNPTITGTTPAARCGPGTVTLNANGSAGTTLRWFSALTGGTLLATGTAGSGTGSYTTPIISATTNYWVEASIGTTTVNVGPASPAGPAGTPATQTLAWDVNFTVLSATNLASIDIFPLTSGQNGTLTVRNGTGSGGTVLATINYTTSVSGGATAQTIPINLALSAGTYSVFTDVLPTSGIRRNNSGASYPYTSSVANITGNGFSSAYFMGLYNWVFSSSCASARTQVTATVNTAPSITPTGTTTICAGAITPLNVSSTNDPNYTYTWMPGSLSGASQSVSPGSTQIYTVTAVDASGGAFNGCSNTGTVTVTVNNVPAATITPTPSNGATGVCYVGPSPVTSVSWAATAGATSYDVYFGVGTVPATVTANVTTNSWTISPALVANTTYSWRVVAKNSCGDAISSTTWSFTTSSQPCYCASSGDAGEGITGVTFNTINNTGTGFNTYTDYTATQSTTVAPGTAYNLSVFVNTGGNFTNYQKAWIDWNQDGVFNTTTEEYTLGTAVNVTNGISSLCPFSITVPSGATLGTTRMRVSSRFNVYATACQTAYDGEVEDYTIVVATPTGCTGTPSGGTVTVTPSEGAPTSTYAVAATGFTSAINITYLWQSNTNGAGWVDIGTASSTYSSLTSLTAPAFGTIIQYRLLVTCTNSSQSAYSSTGTFTSGYCTPSGSNGSYWITNFTTTTGITNINKSSAAGVGGYSNFTADSCSQYQGSSINFSISTNSGTHNFYIWVDWNNDGDFTGPGEAIVASSPQSASYSGSYTIPLTQAAGSFRMRVAQNWSTTALTSCGTSSNGEYEDYIFKVVTLPACSGTPTAGTVGYTGGTLCANVGSATVTNTGYTTGFSGLSYQWLSSNDNFATDTSSVSGGSNPASLSTGALTATTSYLVRAFCSNSGIYSYSNKISVPVNAPAISTTVPASRCDAGTLTISATGTSGSTIRWYSAVTAGTLLKTGTAGSGTDAYTTLPLPYTSNNTYYVEALNGTCTSIPRTAVTANVVPPTTNPTILPSPTITICRDSILTLNASGSTVATTTLRFEDFEGSISTFNIPTPNGDGDYFQSSSYYFEGTKAIGLYSETDFWDWFGLFGEAGNVNMVQATPMDLSSYLDAKLTFYHICATEDGYDFGIVQYNDGTGWKNFPSSAYTGSATLADANGNLSITDQVAFDKASYTDWNATFTDDLFYGGSGYDPGNSPSLWKRETIDLTPYASSSFRVRFRMTFDDNSDYYGWLIDSVAIIGTPAVKYAWSPNTRLYTNPGATIAYDSTVTTDASTIYAKPNDTTTYRAIAYIGNSPNSCSGVTPVTVNVSKKPTATIEAAKPFLCDATAELSASAVVPPSSTLNWTKASGTGSSSATGNPATVSGLAGTTVYNVKGTNGVCVDIPIGTSTVVLPATDNSNIATSPSAGVSVCNYCVYSDGNTKTYYNSTDGKIIASITDETANSASLGETEICFKVEGSVQTVTDNLGNTQPYLERVWTIHPAAGSKATVTLYFTGSELNDLQTAANSGVYQFSSYVGLGLTKYSNGGTTFTPNYTVPASSGGVSVPVTFSSFNGTDHQVQFTVDDFSTFYIHPLLYPNSALPVELVSFTGWNAGEKNELEWKTASELNTLKFVVEKKIDGGSFTYLGELPAAGNSSQLRTYNFSDLNPVVGNNYYRLKIIDTDGKFSYSNIINVPLSEVLTNNFVSVYPNPTGGELNVGIQSTAAYDTKVLVYDIIGTKMFEQNKDLIKGLNTVQFDFSSFAKGAYILHFTDNTGKTHTTKFVKD